MRQCQPPAAMARTTTSAATITNGRRNSASTPGGGRWCRAWLTASRADTTSAAVANRSSGDFARHRRTICDSVGGICGFTSASGGGSCVRTASSVPSVLSALNGRAAGEHFVEHGAEREDIGASIDGLAADLLRSHVPGSAGDERSQRLAGTFLRRRVAVSTPSRRERATGAGVSCSVARPKSRIFTRPSSARKMFSGFRSRWTMPRACAAPSPRATCSAMSSAASTGIILIDDGRDMEVLVGVDAADDAARGWCFVRDHDASPAMPGEVLPGRLAAPSWRGVRTRQSRDINVRPFSGHMRRRGETSPQGAPGGRQVRGKTRHRGRSECGSTPRRDALRRQPR